MSTRTDTLFPYTALVRSSSADLRQAADQSLSNHQDVKVYGARAAEFERYSALADRHMRLSRKVESTRSISSAMLQLMGSSGLAMLLFVAGRKAMAGRLSAGCLVSLMLAMMAIIPALKQLTHVQTMLQGGVASAERMFGVRAAPDPVAT